ncbi:MAG: universal stress protein [Dermabacter sp.]|nr:universal stress protein [Dermabacter sp.]
MVVVAAFAPSSQGDASLLAAISEVCFSHRDLVVASHAFVDPDEGLRTADEREVLSALGRVASRLPERERAYLETLDVKVITSRSRDTGEFLLDTVRATKAGLLVIALRHSSPVSRLSLGHSVRRVILGATCPIFIAKDES